MPAPRTRGSFALLACALGLTAASAQPPTPDQQAAAVLAAGRKAFNDGNPAFAAEKFREFLAKFGGHKDVHAARYGLGLALLDLPDRDYPKAVEALAPPANEPNFPDRPFALYYLGAAHRAAGVKEVEPAAANPAELRQRQERAAPRFADAAKAFGQAREGFEKREPAEPEWAARARADQADCELRAGKVKEARATAEPFVKDAALAAAKARPLGLYAHGFACFLQDDFHAAGRSLGLVAPFDQPFGPHARYLLGRVHAAGGENAEAAAAFDAVLADFEKSKKDAAAALQQPDRFKTNPWEKARLEALVKGPAPDHVAGAVFYGACLDYEAGGAKVAAALAKFQAFVKDFPQSPLVPDAQLRAGFCLVQMRNFAEAARALEPLAAAQAPLAAQANYWLGKARLGLAQAVDANNADARKQAYAPALAALGAAAEKAQQASQQDPAAKHLRGEILLELSDARMQAGLHREGVNAADAVLNEKLLPGKEQEAMQRGVAGAYLSGEFGDGDRRAAAFKQQFPQGVLLPLVLFREAEGAHLRAVAAAGRKDAKAKELFLAAAAKYDALAGKYPEFERAARARFGLGQCLFAADDWEKAAAALDAIPLPERTGDLAAASYMLADCLLRTAPERAEDALQDNMLREKLTTAAGHLDGFAAANPKAAEAPDALLKLGFCHKRLGLQLADPKERNEALQKARAAFEKLLQAYPQSAAFAPAALERAKVMALQGDKGGAAGTLNNFRTDPLQKSPVAPLAYVALATLLREQNQAAQAAAVMAEARAKYEGPLAGDPARVEWVALLRYHHGVALLEEGKATEAKQAFEQVVGANLAKPVSVEAAVKSGEAVAAEVRKKIEAAEKDRQKPGLNPDQIAAADAKVKAVKQELVALAKDLERRADAFKKDHAALEARGRLLYDAAWLYRSASAFAPLNPAGRPLTDADKPDAELAAAAKAAYGKLVAEFPDLALAVDARLELAEVLADGGSADEVVKVLRAAIDQEPADKPTSAETTERLRLRLGAVLFDKKDFAAAQSQFDAVAGNAKSPHRGLALYRSGECLLAAGKSAEAVEKLKVFRDDGTFQQIAGVSDRAVFRLGAAYLALKQWEPARQAFEAVLNRYGNTTWAPEARLGMGQALQAAGRHDDAVNQFLEVAKLTQDERAGRAHLLVGVSRAEQKRWGEAAKSFMAVAYTYDLPELQYPALLEAARVLAEDQKPDEATRLLERVLKDAPADGDYAKAAAERLAKLKKQ